MNSLMAHEESFFYLGILLLAGVQLLYGAARRQRMASLLTIPLVLTPFLANQRRAGSLALIIAFVLLCLVTISLLPRKRRLVVGGLALMAVVLPFYAAFSWNAESLAKARARGEVRHLTQPDLASNEYRDAENFNLNTRAAARLSASALARR
jgi:amino acid permease